VEGDEVVKHGYEYRYQHGKKKCRGSKRKERDVMPCIVVKSVASFCRPSTLHLISTIGS
jgi:hypothetical protein